MFFTDCTPDLYVQLPYQVYYANPGDQLCVVCNSTAISIQTGLEALVSFVIAGFNQPFCNKVPGCVIDSVQDQLCFNEGIPEGSFGSYICQHAIDLNSYCEVPFNITKASKHLSLSFCLSPWSSFPKSFYLVYSCGCMQLVEDHYV